MQPATGITGHDDTNYGAGFKLRANPTLVSAVLNPGNTFINSAMTYDVAGNILTVTDPNNHLTTLLYGDSYQDGVGRGSFAHPTNVINALNQITTAQYDYWTGAIVGGIVDLFGLFFGLFGHGHGGATAPPPIPAVPPVSSYPGVEIGEVTSSNNGPLAEDIINTAGGSQSNTVFYAEAIAYLNRDAVMARIIRQLQRSRKVYTVSFINNGDDSYLSGKVYWDPTSSLRTTSGGCQSAALGLGHELSHAYEQDQYPYWFAREQGVSAGSYGNQVEKWAITGPETHAARKLGESTRSDHGGQTRHETDATSRNCRQP